MKNKKNKIAEEKQNFYVRLNSGWDRLAYNEEYFFVFACAKLELVGNGDVVQSDQVDEAGLAIPFTDDYYEACKHYMDKYEARMLKRFGINDSIRTRRILDEKIIGEEK